MALTAVAEIQKFKGSQEAELFKTLERADRTTEIIPIGCQEDVLMNSNGTFGNGLRATRWALYQLSKHLCPGLYNCLDELVTLEPDKGIVAAVDIFNRIVRLRFRDTLAGYMWLVDQHTKTIEAVVSSKYRFVSNLAAYQTIKDALSPIPTKFQEAELAGRWMLLRFYDPRKLFAIGEQRFFKGFHFSNHEGGQASLHAANTVVRDGPLTFAANMSGEQHVRHVGGSIKQRIKDVLSRIMSHKIDLAAIENNVKVLMGQTLGLGLAKEEDEDKRRKDLVGQLSARERLHKTLASRILAGAITQPHNVSEPRPAFAISRKDLQALTSWDLVIALCREAKSLPIASRERAEQLSYALLTGRLRLR